MSAAARQGRRSASGPTHTPIASTRSSGPLTRTAPQSVMSQLRHPARRQVPPRHAHRRRGRGRRARAVVQPDADAVDDAVVRLGSSRATSTGTSTTTEDEFFLVLEGGC
jgi:hypothetical protein